MADPASMHAAQLKVRQEAQEMQDFLSDLRSWETTVKAKDERLKAAYAAKRAVAPPAFAPPASDADPAPTVVIVDASSGVRAEEGARGGAGDAAEREAGNEAFKKGDFAGAVKRYTRAIALWPKDALAYSNRAMAYIRMKEYIRALDDSTAALALDSNHVKSLLRRATAANALGKHKLAETDLTLAASLEPHNKQVAADLRKTLEMRKAAIRRAPLTNIPVEIVL